MKLKFKWGCIILIAMMFFGIQAFGAGDVPANGKFFQEQASPEAANWLQFFAVTPCRIYDSRNSNSIGNGGLWYPGDARPIWIDDIESTEQGDTTFCAAPLDINSWGEPLGVHVYMVAIPVSGAGNFLPFPPQYGIPTRGAALNYKAGVQNVGNAVSVQTWNAFPGEDLGVLNRYGFSHLTLDVFGYYY